MVNNALGAMANNVLAAKWPGGEMVDKALRAKWYVVLQARLAITHTANLPLNHGRYLANSQVGDMGW